MLDARRMEILAALRRELGDRIEEDALTSQDDRIEIGDRSVAVLGQDVELGRLEMKRRALRQIDDVLARIDDGTYGLCEDCEVEIAEERLDILPFATRCVECERKREVEERPIETTGRGFRSGFRDVREDGQDAGDAEDGDDADDGEPQG